MIAPDFEHSDPGAAFLLRGGETGALIAAHDWSATDLGPISDWPQSLKTTLGILLHSPVPIVLLWGADGVMLYNDAYSVFAGGRHPQLLGSKVREGWPEVADFNDHVMKVGLAGGTLAFRDQELTLHRHGRPEQVWMNLDYSPVFGEDGTPHGVIAIVVETTDRVRVERAMAAQHRLLETMFDQAPAAIAMLEGPDHVFVLSNAAHRLLTGRSDVVGKPVREAEPGLEGQGIYELLDQVYRSGEPYFGRGVPVTYAYGEGPPEERILDFLYQPVRDAGGDVRGIFALALDVTDRVRNELRLRESEARVELAARASGVGIWDWRLDANEVVFTSRAKSIWGFPENADVTQAMMAEAMHPDDIAETNDRFRRATDPSVRDRSPYQYRVVRDDGVRWVRAHAEAIFEERDGELVATRYVGTMVDVTEEVEREAALRSSEARLKLAIEAGRMAVWSLKAEGEVDVTPEFNRLLGLPEDARPTLAELQARYYPGELERLQRLAETTLGRGDRFMEFEYRHLWPDDTVRWLLVRAEFLFDGAGVATGAIGVVMDITDRHESEERLRLLAREVDHRANNLLATVQGAISLTRAGDLPTYKEALLGRVAALANAHQLLAASRWHGADLRSLVEEEFRPYSENNPQRVSLDGPTWELSPESAQAIAMVIHELTTNAVKYGALSVSDGRISVRWRVEDQERVIEWVERGGPPVVRPTRTGMGTIVLARALEGSVGGRTVVEWAPTGVVCRIHMPVPAP